MKAHTAGAGADSLWAALDGDGDITLSDGTLSGLDLVALSKAVKSAPSADKVDLTGLLARGGTSALQALGGDFTIEEGRVSLPKLLLLTRDSKAEGAVTLDLKSNQIDGRTTLRFGDRPDAPSLLLQLGGPLNAVTLGPDASAAASLVIPETPEASIQSSGKMKVVKGVALEADTTGTSEANPIPLAFNWNGIFHAGEVSSVDDPNGFRSIADRALVINGGTFSFGTIPLIGNTGMTYTFEPGGGTFDVVHLGNAAISTATGTCPGCPTRWFDVTTGLNANRGIQPAWLVGLSDHLNPQTTDVSCSISR